MDDFSDLPPARRTWALFFDVDGTLIPIAPTPNEAAADVDILSSLTALNRNLGGAIALVSGRPISQIDRLFAPLRLPVAGLHGRERRAYDGRLIRPEAPSDEIETARRHLRLIGERLPGVIIEDKGSGFAIHYRQVPEYEPQVLEAAADAVARAAGALKLLRGKMVAELAPLGDDKGGSVRAFMSEAPFRGRIPVFVGDDVTDEDGFRAANGLNGISVRVGDDHSSAAGYRIADVAGLRAWLRQVLGELARA